MVQVLKRGGHFLCLEFSPQAVQGLQTIYDWYSFNVIPQMGRCAALLLCCQQPMHKHGPPRNAIVGEQDDSGR